MLNPFIKAKLISLNRLQVMVFSDRDYPNKVDFYLYKDNKEEIPLNIVQKTYNNSFYFYELEMPNEYDFSSQYELALNEFPLTRISLSEVGQFPNFDDLFFYNGDDLGSIYTKEETSFSLWAPLAEKVFLKISKDEKFLFYEMKRYSKGVFRISLKGDCKNAIYHYIVINDEVRRESNDPYAKAVSLNSEYSVVINLDELDEIPFVPLKENISQYVEHIIYEANIRDLSEDKNSTIEKKGKYLGLTEENKVTKNGHPAGLDYLKYLGITTLQLQPVLDFANVDDINYQNSYNWGYDVTSFFALEGSYSINPKDPISRLKEFKTLINFLHKNNIRVVLDVVYNHIYDYINSTFEKCVPNYYFRRKANKGLANASGCGNDFASEKLMARKIIIDSLIYLLKTFDVDGFRFDLMGLLDIETINQARSKLQEIKPSIILYGEGWNMCYELPFEKKACYQNHALLKDVAFFNDSYRDFVKGPSFSSDLYIKGYICGDSSYKYGLDYSFFGSTLFHSYEPRFINANQSLNYLECHDNATLFDKLLISNKEESLEIRLKRITLANAILMFSFGIPFFHMGQEIGQSKNGQDNTYNVVGINKLNYEFVDERFDMVENFANLVKLKKSLPYPNLSSQKDLMNLFKIIHFDNDIYGLSFNKVSLLKNCSKLMVLINPTNEDKSYQLDDEYLLFKEEENYQKGQIGVLSPCSLVILFVK